MEYGLIGSKLGHSYSKIIHEMLCGYRYDLCPLPTEEEARAFLTRRAFKAINVTIPYKRLVMGSCSYIDPRAKAIGAVNTVVNRNGLLYGYNTDYLGFAYLADAHGVEFAGRTVLILGTGGTHNTTSAVAKDKGAARVLTVSRHPDPEKGELSYAEAVHSGADIVINTTPAGMGANLLHRAGRRTAEGTQHAPGQRKAGELCQQLPVSGIYRHIAAAGQNLLCRAGDLLALHQQGKGLVSGVQRPGDHLGAFGDKDALFRLQSVAQLRLREPSVDVQLRGGKVGDLMNDRHGKTPLK